MSDRLTVTDLRMIARAVNSTGKLQSLQPWFDNISDEQLSMLGGLIYDFLFQDAMSQGSAVDLLEKRIENKFFTDFALAIEFLSLGRDTGQMFGVAKTLLGHKDFPLIVDLNAHWLDPLWGRVTRKHIDRRSKVTTDVGDEGGSATAFGPDQGTKGWVYEAHTILHDTALTPHWIAIGEKLQNTHFASDTIAFLSGQRTPEISADPSTAASERAPPLKAVLPKIRAMATKEWEEEPSESQLMAFLGAVNKLNGPAHGLFGQLHRLLEKPGIARTFGNILQPQARGGTGPLPLLTKYQPLVPTVLAGYLRRNINRGIAQIPINTPEFWTALAYEPPKAVDATNPLAPPPMAASEQPADALKPAQKSTVELMKEADDAYVNLNQVIAESIQDITGTAIPFGTAGAASFNLPIYVNSLVLTEWITRFARANIKTLSKVSAKSFTKRFWNLQVSFPIEKIPLTKVNGEFLPDMKDKLRLVLRNLPNAAVDDALKQWEQLLLERRGGDVKIESPLVDEQTVASAFEAAVQSSDQILPFADLSAVIRIGLFYLTEPGNKGQSFLQELDNGNLLVRINEKLAALPPQVLDTLAGLTTGNTDLAELVKIFRDLYEGEGGPTAPQTPEEEARKTEILEAVHTLAAIVTTLGLEAQKDGGEGIRPALMAYVDWLKAIGNSGLPAVGDVLNLVQGSGLLSADLGTKKFTYPALTDRILGTEKGPASFLGFEFWTLPEIFELERGFRLSFAHADDTLAVPLYLDWVRTLPKAEQRTEGWDGLAKVFLSSTDSMTEDERLWLQHFIRQSGVHRAWQFFGTNGSWGQSASLFQELIKLVESKSIEAPLELLDQIRDDRIKRIARVLKKWYQSGQLREFLRAAEKVFHQQ